MLGIWNPHTLLMGIEEVTIMLWKTVWQFLKRLHKDLLDPAISLLGIYPREMKTYLHKNMFMHVHSSIIHNSPKGETAQMSIN